MTLALQRATCKTSGVSWAVSAGIPSWVSRGLPAAACCFAEPGQLHRSASNRCPVILQTTIRSGLLRGKECPLAQHGQQPRGGGRGKDGSRARRDSKKGELDGQLHYGRTTATASNANLSARRAAGPAMVRTDSDAPPWLRSA